MGGIAISLSAQGKGLERKNVFNYRHRRFPYMHRGWLRWQEHSGVQPYVAALIYEQVPLPAAHLLVWQLEHRR